MAGSLAHHVIRGNNNDCRWSKADEPNWQKQEDALAQPAECPAKKSGPVEMELHCEALITRFETLTIQFHQIRQRLQEEACREEIRSNCSPEGCCNQKHQSSEQQ